ncbi:cutinase family protein [Actinomycetes bacterium M1A6_2h]
MSFTRPSRRVVAGIAALASLGVVAAGAVALSGGGTASTGTPAVELVSTSTCYDMVSIGIGGRNGAPGAGVKLLTDANGNQLPAALSDDFESDWVDEVVSPANSQVNPDSYAAIYLQYPANMSSYDNAVDTGVSNAKSVMSAISASCPDTRFAIVGYSEGADVARRTAMEVGNQTPTDGKYAIVDPANVVGVVILADAGRQSGEGPFPGAQNPYNRPDNFDTNYQSRDVTATGAGALPGTSGSFGALDGKVASFCSGGDLTCSLPESTSIIHLLANVGRQVNVDAFEREGLTPATAADVATVIGRVAFFALNDIASQPNWLAGDETFLDVLIKVSEPGYDPSTAATPVAKDESTTPIDSDQAANLAYLPSKLFKEVVGLIADNQNTIPILMNDPYGLTLGPGVGHHFDYWRDSDPANGKPLTSAQYAAAWITQLAKDAQAKKPITSPEVKQAALRTVQADPVAAVAAVQAVVATDETSTAEASTTTNEVTATTTDTSTTPLPPTDPSSSAPLSETTTSDVTATQPESATTTDTATTPLSSEETSAPTSTTAACESAAAEVVPTVTCPAPTSVPAP